MYYLLKFPAGVPKLTKGAEKHLKGVGALIVLADNKHWENFWTKDKRMRNILEGTTLIYIHLDINCVRELF